MQITLTGLCLVVINLATLLYYDPEYKTVGGGAQGPPNWIYFTQVLLCRSTAILHADKTLQ